MTFHPRERFNVADYFLGERLREGRGDRVALRLPRGKMTYAEVDALATRVAATLRTRDIRPEDRVMIALPDGAEWVAAFFATLKLGGVVVMVNPGLKVDNLATLFDYTAVRLTLVDAACAASFSEAAKRAETPPELLVTGDGHGSLAAETEGASGEIETAGTHRDDPAIWLFSGGTTGLPKGVVQTHASFANTTELYAKAALGYREDDVTLSVPKLFFGYATGSNLLFPFAVGASAVLFPEHPTPEVVFERIRRHRPTILVNVPKMVNQMVEHPDASSQDLSCLRFATSAGEALPVSLHERWKRTFGVELLDGLGTAEMWHIFITNTPDDVKPGTLGKPVKGFDVRVRDEEGRDLAAGEVGRLWVRGGSRAIAYWRNMSATQQAFQGEWFVGGDLVRRDADGYVTYCGRGDDVLKVSGKWLAPGEVESCLMEHPAVRECAIVGVENHAGLTEPVAFVVTSAASDDLSGELKQHCLDHLDAYKHPRRVLLLDDLPRTHLGKVDRGALKRLASG